LPTIHWVVSLHVLEDGLCCGSAALLSLSDGLAHDASLAITIDDGPVVNEMQDLANFERVSIGLIGSPSLSRSAASRRRTRRIVRVAHGNDDGQDDIGR